MGGLPASAINVAPGSDPLTSLKTLLASGDTIPVEIEMVCVRRAKFGILEFKNPSRPIDKGNDVNFICSKDYVPQYEI